MLEKHSFGNAFAKLLTLNLVLTVTAVLLVLPFTWMILTSLKLIEEIGADSWLPEVCQWHNYKDVFSTKGIFFGRWYWNTIFVSCWITFLQVFTSSLAAFSFSRLRWKGRDQVFFLYLATMMLPGLVMMIPNYQNMIRLHLVDTYVGLILPGAFSAFGTFLMRQFMMNIPKSLDEAAEIDGASATQRTFLIDLPLCRNSLGTSVILSVFWPLVLMKSPDKYTLPIGMLSFDSSAGQQTNLLMAAVAMSVLPMIVIFVAMQKQLVKGIMLGGVKG